MDEPDSRDPNEIAAEARRIWAKLAAAVVAVLVGVVAIALLAGGRPVGPGHGVYDAGTTDPLQAAVPLLEAYVESERGLRFHGKVKISVVNAVQLAEVAGRSAVTAKSAPATNRAATLSALGFTPPTGVAIPAGSGYGSDAYYSYATRTIYLLAGRFDAFGRAVLVHELTLALDDEQYGLLRMTRDAAGNTDSLQALDALLEGDATRVELSYVASLSRADEQAVKSVHDYDPKASTYASNVASFGPTAGADFVTALLNKGGNKQVDAAFRTPPTATTQILGPKSYLNGDEPSSMREPHVQGKVLDRGSLGQFGLSMVLTGGARYRNVSVLADMQGDSYVTTQSGGKVCVTDTVLMPTNVTRDELVHDMNAEGVPAGASGIDNSLKFQRCR